MNENELIKICKKYLNYNPITGSFKWIKTSPYHKRFLDKEAGRVNHKGYRMIGIKGKQYQAHQLAFLIYHGKKATVIDHVNGIKDDNRIINLRECTLKENSINRNISSRNKSGYKGVVKSHTNKWRSQINGICLGDFSCKHYAARVWNIAARMYQGYKFCYTNQVSICSCLQCSLVDYREIKDDQDN